MNMGKGYYSVTIHSGAVTQVHTVFALSDYAAAIKVRNMTGCMARSEEDVCYIFAHAPVWHPTGTSAVAPATMALAAQT